MKTQEFLIEGELNEVGKLALTNMIREFPGVKDAVLEQNGDSCFTLILRLSFGADEEAVAAEVKRIAVEVGADVYDPDSELDRIIREFADDEKTAKSNPSAEAEEAYETYEDTSVEPSLGFAVNTSDPEASSAEPEKGKRGRRVSLTAAVSTVITAVVLAVLLTFSLTTTYMKNNAPQTVTPGQGTTQGSFAELELIDRLFRSATVLEPQDKEALLTAVLKSYVAATGDVYAEYYTPEEYQQQNNSNNGEMCGIGVSVVNGVLNLNGVDRQVITVASVYPDSPAEAAGVLPGDHIVYLGSGEDRVPVHTIGYTEALNRMKGEEGTECSFTVLRRPAGTPEGTPYEEVEITAIRKKMLTRSVIFRHYSEDDTVGIIRLTGFDFTTYDQFVEAVETLKAEGCQSFVLDLRGNPGGLLASVEDVLTLFLRLGDTIITTKDAAGSETVTKVELNARGEGLVCGTGKVSPEDVGKYRELKISVLVNEFSASAAELFTSNIRDYELGTIVGTTTYGKGCGQTTYSLSRYGYDGALKLTTFYYYPPCGEGYHGIGIKPHVEVELSEEAKLYNINLLPDHLDNQLTAAVQALK